MNKLSTTINVPGRPPSAEIGASMNEAVKAMACQPMIGYAPLKSCHSKYRPIVNGVVGKNLDRQA